MNHKCESCILIHNRDRKATRAHYPMPNVNPEKVRYYCGHCFNNLLRIIWVDDDEEIIWRLAQ